MNRNTTTGTGDGIRQRRMVTVVNDNNDDAVTATTTLDDDESIKKNNSSSSPSSFNILCIAHLYSIIWCLHYLTPYLDDLLYNFTNYDDDDADDDGANTTISSSTTNGHGHRRSPPLPIKRKKSILRFIPALDHRSLTDVYDYCILLPIILYIIFLYIRWMYVIMFHGSSSSSSTKPQSSTDHHHRHQQQQQMSLSILIVVYIAHFIDTIIIRGIVRMPHVWDHEQWAMICNGMFLTCFIHITISSSSSSSIPMTWLGNHTTTTTTSAVSSILTITTYYWLRQSSFLLGLLYGTGTFWKFTTSFWSTPTTSCGSLLVLEMIVTYYIPGEPIPPSVAQWAITIGPYITVFIEALISIGMIYLSITSRPTDSNRSPHTTTSASKTRTVIRNVLVITTMLFHLSIYMLPINAAGGFSLDCMTRLIYFFHPQEVYTTVFSHSTTIYSKISRYRVWMICLIVWIRYKGTGYPVDAGFLFYCLLMDLYIMMMFPSSSSIRSSQATTTNSTNSTTTATMPYNDKVSSTTKILSNVMILVGIVYGVGLTVLGLEQMGAPTMYSNLRSYYGGNHLLVRTGLLGDDVLYGGHLVQIVYSTCDTVNQLLGYIDSAYIEPEPLYTYQKSLLRNSSIPDTPIQNQNLPIQFFPLCLSNPHSKQLLMKYYRKSNPLGQPVPFQFILPLNVVNRAIQNARRNNHGNETFIVKIADGGKSSELKHPPTLEVGVTEVIVLNEQGGCTVELYTTTMSMSKNKLSQEQVGRTLTTTTSCNGHYLGKLLLPRDDKESSSTTTWMDYFVSKLLRPYPQIVGEGEEICMS